VCNRSARGSSGIPRKIKAKELDIDTDKWIKHIEDYNGIDIIPGLGWRIDVGKPGRLFITPSIKSPIIIRWWEDPSVPDPRIGVIFISYLGFGYAF